MTHRHASRARHYEGDLHTLYRFYDASERLLYVGITCNPGHRLEAHRRHKTWWRDVARIALEQHENRAQLAAAELAAIRNEKPTHNIVGIGPTRGTQRRVGPSPLPPAPAGDVDFYEYDHGELATWPEYIAVGQAIDDLAHRVERANLGETQGEFEQIFTDLARHMVIGHSCHECRDAGRSYKLYAPYACEEAGDSRFAMHYVCDLEHGWSMWVHPRARTASMV